jgi:hypothetical protein
LRWQRLGFADNASILTYLLFCVNADTGKNLHDLFKKAGHNISVGYRIVGLAFCISAIDGLNEEASALMCLGWILALLFPQ